MLDKEWIGCYNATDDGPNHSAFWGVMLYPYAKDWTEDYHYRLMIASS